MDWLHSFSASLEKPGFFAPDHLAVVENPAKRRILFLADRNILADQAIQNDFKPFDSQIVHKIQNRAIDKSYEIYFALYQAVSGTEEVQNVYREFSRDFFDMVVVDECHRGSAAADSAWREILDYFSSATQLGLTATPKETKYISNIDYFGQPIYNLLPQTRHRRWLPGSLQSDSHQFGQGFSRSGMFLPNMGR